MKFVLILLMFVAILGWSQGHKSEEDRDYSSINLQHLKTIEETMDTKVKPCSNFHKYVCDNWSLGNDFSVMTKVKKEINREFIKYMDDTPTTAMPEFVKKAHEYYTTCTDAEHVNLLDYMKWIEEHDNMKWALLSSSENTNAVFDWVYTLGIMRKYDMNDLFIEEDMYDKKSDPSKVIIDLNKPISYNGFEPLKEYQIEQLNSAGENTTQPTVKIPIELWKEISEFEELLVKLYEVKDNSEQQLVTVKDLPLPWLSKYLEVILPPNTLNSNMELTIQNIPYMEALDALLKEYDAKFISRYLEVRFLWYIYGTIEPSDSALCMKSTKEVFPMAMHWIYEQLHPEIEKDVPKIQEMFGNLIENINKTLRSDQSGIIPEEFLSKLNTMQLKIGNLPRVDTIKVLDSHYAPLQLKKSDICGNHLQLLKLHFHADHMHTTNQPEINVNEYFNERENYGLGRSIDPHYVSSANIVIVPAELLRAPFYNAGYDDIFNYGSLGTILARYIYNDIDFEGLTKSEKERLIDYISLSTSTGFVFSSFPVELNEKHYPMNNEQMSMKKLFFINAVYSACEMFIDDDVDRKIARLPQFAETFECKLNDILKIFD